MLPEFDIQFARQRAQRRVAARLASHIVPEQMRPFHRSHTHDARGGLIATRSANEERALAPIVGDSADPSPPAARDVSGRATREPAVEAVKKRIDAFLRRHDRPELRASWRHAANQAQRELRRLETLDLSAHRFLLLARQTHPLLRALILRAEEQRVPVVYVPHSPLTRFQVDLPVTHAGLRGEAERDWLVAATHADSRRIDVVGNPATDLIGDSSSMPPAARPGLLAVSPDPEPHLRRMVDLLVQAGLDDVVVAPHPRSDREVLRRLLPSGWSLANGGRTSELLRAGPRWVIQCASGVSWESAVLGLPTGDIRLDDRPPVYPHLDDPGAFPALRTVADVRQFVTRSATADRASIREAAMRWCRVDGQQSIDRAQALLDSVSAPLPRIVDAWAPDGVLRGASPLADL